MAIERVVILMLLVSSLISLVSATDGIATFYTKYVPSACYGSKKIGGTMIAAANNKLYNNGKACGKKFRVRCTGGTNEGPHPCRKGKVITVRIVDLCDGCAHNQLDLSLQAFSKIANPDAGEVRINFERV